MPYTNKKYFEPVVIFGLILSVLLNLFVIFQYVIVTSETSKHNETQIIEIKESLRNKVSIDSFTEYNGAIKELVCAIKADNKDKFNEIITRIERLENKWISRSRGNEMAFKKNVITDNIN